MDVMSISVTSRSHAPRRIVLAAGRAPLRALSNRQRQELEITASHCKQTMAIVPNRQFLRFFLSDSGSQ
jgi:hypothetical protein